MKLVIYIPTYNRLGKLKTCLESIAPQADGVKVYVSNNASTDGTKDYLDGLDYPWLIVHHQPENYGGAYNQAAAWYIPVDAEYVWVIGDDDYLLPGAVPTLLDATKHNTDFIFCNTQAYPAKDEEAVMREPVLPKGKIKGRYTESYLCPFSDLVDPAVADSLLLEIMCLCVRKSAVKEVDIESLKAEPEDTFASAGRYYTAVTAPLLESFTGGTKGLYLHPPLTFNFWNPHGYSGNYDYIFPVAILYMIEMYRKNKIIDHARYLGLLRYYFHLMGGPLYRQLMKETKAKPFSDEILQTIESHYEVLRTA